MALTPERLSINASPDRQSPQDLARAQYEEDWRQFLQMPAVVSIREQLLQIEGELGTLKNGSKEGNSLKGQLDQLNQRGALQQAAANRVRDRYNNARGDGKRRLYDVLAKTGLKPLGERLLYPLEITQIRYRKTRKAIAQTERIFAAAEDEFWAKKSSLEEKKRAVGNAWQQAEEMWVLQNGERLFVYVLDNLGSDERRKERLFQRFAQERGIDLQRLNREFEEFTALEVVVNQEVVTKSSSTEELVREEGSDAPFNWHEWVEAFSGWRKEDDGNAEIINQEGERVFPIAIVRQTAGKGLSVQSVTEQEIERFISKQAGKFASGDERMMADCRAMVEYIQKWPDGYGTEKLAKRRKVDGKLLAIYSLDPREMTNLMLQHERSGRLRLVYMIYRQDRQLPIIALVGIYKHEDYDRKFK